MAWPCGCWVQGRTASCCRAAPGSGMLQQQVVLVLQAMLQNRRVLVWTGLLLQVVQAMLQLARLMQAMLQLARLMQAMLQLARLMQAMLQQLRHPLQLAQQQQTQQRHGTMAMPSHSMTTCQQPGSASCPGLAGPLQMLQASRGSSRSQAWSAAGAFRSLHHSSSTGRSTGSATASRRSCRRAVAATGRCRMTPCTTTTGTAHTAASTTTACTQIGTAGEMQGYRQQAPRRQQQQLGRSRMQGWCQPFSRR
jgi:hypothetical protein